MRTNYMIRAAPESCHDLRLHSDVWVQAMQAAQHLGLCSSQCNGESRRIIEALPYMSLHAGVHSCRRISDECSTVTETHVTQCTCDVGIIQVCGHYCDESEPIGMFLLLDWRMRAGSTHSHVVPGQIAIHSAMGMFDNRISSFQRHDFSLPCNDDKVHTPALFRLCSRVNWLTPQLHA
jgi:hypothetical protein